MLTMALGIVCEAVDLALVCRVCGAPFSYIKTGPGRLRRYCSKDCERARKRAPKRTLSKGCVVCGRLFATVNSRTHCCSAACVAIKVSATLKAQAEERREKRTCEQCGSLFTPARRSAKQLRDGHVQQCCSRKCLGLSRRKTPTPKPTLPKPLR